MSDSLRPHGLQPTRLLCPWDFPGKSTGVGCHCLLRERTLRCSNIGSYKVSWGFPGGTSGKKNLPANAGDIREAGLIPRLGRSSGVGNGNPPQYSCLENSMDRGDWRAIVHGVAESDTNEATQHAWSFLATLYFRFLNFNGDGTKRVSSPLRAFPWKLEKFSLFCRMTKYVSIHKQKI